MNADDFNNRPIVIPIDLGPTSAFETTAWLSTAILLHLDMDIRLTEKSQALIQGIRTDEVERTSFEAHLAKLQEPNFINFVELGADDAQRVKDFVLKETLTA